MVERIGELLRLKAEWQAQLVVTALLLIVLMIGRKIVTRVLNRRIEDLTIRFYVQKLSTYGITLLGFFLLFPIWVKNAGNLGTQVAILTTGLTIALSDVLKNLAGWLFILLRRPFKVGDRIEIGDHMGDVVDVQGFQFSLFEIQGRVHGDDPTGRLIQIPNGEVFTQSITNFSSGFQFMWQETELLVTFESDWRRGREVLLEIMQEHSDPAVRELASAELNSTEEAIQFDVSQLDPIVYIDVHESGVNLTGRHLVRVLETRRMEDKVWVSILEALEREPSLELAYPTVRTYLRDPIAVTTSGNQQLPADAAATK